MANVCDSYCKGCIYVGKSQGLPCCRYVFVEDKLRPCPPGTGCTVKLTNKDVKRRNEEERKAIAVERMKLQAELRAQKHREHLAKKQAAQEAKRKPCKHCGKIFLPSKEHRDHCSSECAYQYHLITENERSRKRYAAMRAAKEKKQTPNGDANT